MSICEPVVCAEITLCMSCVLTVTDVQECEEENSSMFHSIRCRAKISNALFEIQQLFEECKYNMAATLVKTTAGPACNVSACWLVRGVLVVVEVF